MEKRRSKIFGYIILLLMFIGLGKYLWCRINDKNNLYFFDDSITQKVYEGYVYPLSCNEIWQNITLNIIHIETFDNAALYALELEQLNVTDPEDMMTMGRRYLGYFYVTNTHIYRVPVYDYEGFTEAQSQKIIDCIQQDEQTFLEMSHVVCSEEGVKDSCDEDGYHSGVRNEGTRKRFYYYNDNMSGTKDYEEIVWEKNQGIVYYKRGTGSMKMHIEFGIDLGEMGTKE